MRGFLILFLLGCTTLWQQPETPNTTCDAARNLLHACGASFALFERLQCSGPALLAANCLIEHGGDCEELSDVGEACAQVIFDELDSVEPLDLPGEECRPPAALPSGTLFEIERQVHRVEGLTYCLCFDSPPSEVELCAAPVLLSSVGCVSNVLFVRQSQWR